MMHGPPDRRFGCFVVVGVAVWLGACATNPVTGKREFSLMSESREIQIGRQLDAEVRQEMGVYDDEALQRYVEDIGLRLALGSQRPTLPWHFTVVDVPAVNAFALPGGYIYITRGILAYLDDEAALAGVLGHEIGHVTARHAAQAYTRAAGVQYGLILGSIFAPGTRQLGDLAQTGLGLLFLKNGRDAELQADRLGAEYAARSGWDPAGVAEMLTTLARIQATSNGGVPNWLSTHPAAADRVTKVHETVEELRATVDANFVTEPSEYLTRIDGLVFGGNPEDGIMRGNAFLHPVMRFAVTFPEGWEIVNGSTQVVARQPGDEAYLVLQVVEQTGRQGGRSLEEVAARSMRSAGYRFDQGALTTLNGLEAYLGTYHGKVQGLGKVVARAAHIVHGRNVFAFIGIAAEARYPRAARDVEASLASFRALTRTEADAIYPNHIALYVVRNGDTWQSIAQHAGQDNVMATTLAIMNGSPVNDQPRPHDRIKIVVGGSDEAARGQGATGTRRAPTNRRRQ